jgi:hypothetical protein
VREVWQAAERQDIQGGLTDTAFRDGHDVGAVCSCWVWRAGGCRTEGGGQPEGGKRSHMGLLSKAHARGCGLP